MRLLLFLIAVISFAFSAEDANDTDGEESRKILGSSVVTSVSVIMDTGNGSKTVFTDAVGKPVPKPSSASELASPIDLLNPDRYEFYTFDDNGDLIKRLMSLDEIQGIIATGDSDGYDLDSFTSLGYLPEKKVNDVVNNVQNVLKEEMETHKTSPEPKPIFDTPDVSDSWSMILPAVFGNSGEDIKPERPITHVTPDTIMIEPNMQNAYLSTFDNAVTTSPTSVTSANTPRSTSFTDMSTKTPTVSTTSSQISTTNKLQTIKTASTTNIIPLLTPVTEQQNINVEIYSNSKSTTEKLLDQLGVENVPTVEIKPIAIGNVSGISEEPKISTRKPPTTVKIAYSTQYSQTEIKYTSHVVEDFTEQPVTIASFVPSSMGSTLPTTKTPPKPTTQELHMLSTLPPTSDVTESTIADDTVVFTKHTTEEPVSTWRPELMSATTTESQTVTEVPLSTWIPELDTTEKIQTLSDTDNSPTLIYLLNLNKNISFNTSDLLAATTASEIKTNDINNNEELTTTEYTLRETSPFKEIQSTDKYIQDDSNTLGSELVTTKLNESESQTSVTTTQLSLEQSMNNDQKVSASELLDQLLFTTNIYEINTELGEKTTEQQIFSNEDERFETSTQESKMSETKTEIPITTEQFLIKITENDYHDEDSTTDDAIMNSLEQLLSQAVGNVEEVVTTINDTQSVQNVLNSGNKNMSDVQIESATLASSLISSNSNFQENEKTTTEKSVLDLLASDGSNLLSDSVGSLISQVYESGSTVTTSTEIPTTEKYPTTISEKDNNEYIVFSTAASNRFEDVTITKQDFGNNAVTFPEPEKTTTDTYESTTTTDLPISTILPDKNASEDNSFIPHLINITIIRPDAANSNTRNSSYKPAKSDVSLEQILDEEYKKNVTLAESIETSYNSIDKTPNEILNAEETMAALYNNSGLTTTKEPVTETTTVTQETTELSTEGTTLVTTEQFITVKENLLEKEPTTVVIIRRTSKPPSNTDDKFNENTETTTTMDEKLFESTTDSKQISETTQFVTEESVSTTTDLVQEEISTESVTEKNIKPSVQIVIIENSSLISNKSSNIVENSNKSVSENKPQVSKITNSGSLKKEETVYKDKLTANKPDSTWTLVPTVAPHSESNIFKHEPSLIDPYSEIIDPPAPVDLEAKPLQGFGLEDSTSKLDADIYQFAQLCNELAFGFWKTVTNGLSSARSVFVSPFGATSLLAMVFLGARGSTSGEMNEILRLDDMVTFNPHLIFKNVSESIKADEYDSGVASSAIIRELFSDRSKGKLLPFYKERARAFYDGYVEEASFREIGDVIRRRTNLQVKKYTNGKISEYLKHSYISARSPLAGVSVNIFQTDCSHASTDGRDGEIHFVVLPSIRQRRLIPVPAVVYRSGFLAGYEPSLDATAVALGMKEQTVSTILVIPGQQGISAPGDGLSRLERRLVESSFKKGAWSRLLRALIPRPGLEVQIPRFSHRSVINATIALKKMGLHDLFDVEKADLRGLNGVANELFLSDMIQINNFATCGEKRIGDTHHSEIYPATASRARNSRYLDHFESEESFWRSELLEEPRDYQRSFPDPLYDPSFFSLPLSQRPRQARVPESPRLRFDRPFLYFVRHNPTGLILHMGRFNPRLLP